MTSNVNKAHGLKRSQVITSSDKTSSRKPSKSQVNCYFTLGRLEDNWHMWNTAPGSLTLRTGDLLRACIVASDFEGTTSLLTRVLKDVTIPGSGETTCILGQDIRFEDDDLEPIVDLRSVATQVDFVAMCMSKGVKCAIFLEHHIQTPKDEELQLGSRVCSLFRHTVDEMLSRKYDIMHHYPLFNRALGLYYSDNVSLEPPEPINVIATGGLLDRSVADHQSRHGIPLVGVDHISFSHWSYPDNNIEDQGEEEQERQGRDERGEEPSSNGDQETQGDNNLNNVDDDDSAESQTPGEPSSDEVMRPVSPCLRRDEVSELFTVNTLPTFNNLPGP